LEAQGRPRSALSAEKEKAPRERGSEREENMNNSKAALMITLFSCMGQGKKHYSVVSAQKILKLLKSYHKIEIQRRWLFQCLRDLLDAGLIGRKARYKRRGGGLIGQIPSMLTFTLKGARYLVIKRVSGALQLLKSILKYVTGDDQRWPRVENVIKRPPGVKEKANQRELTKLLNKIAGKL